MKCQEELARAIAKAKGEESEAARALKDYEARRAQGEDVIVFPLRGTWLVGPADSLNGQVREASDSARSRAVQSTRTKSR